MEVIRLGLFSIETGLLTYIYLYLIIRYNPGYNLNFRKELHVVIWLFSLLCGCVITFLLVRWGIVGQFSCGTLAAYLLSASITDIRTCEVYDFLPLITTIIGVGTLLLTAKWEWLIPFALFFVIQLTIFMRMYGRADGYAFLVCALYESRFGQGILTYLLHMGASVLLLSIVQGIKGNIDQKGNLTHPVPFLPYISVTVWWFL